MLCYKGFTVSCAYFEYYQWEYPHVYVGCKNAVGRCHHEQAHRDVLPADVKPVDSYLPGHRPCDAHL